MAVPSFTCNEERCWKFSLEVPLDKNFLCSKFRHCIGNTLLNSPPALPAPGFWRPHRLLLATAAAIAIGLVTASFIGGLASRKAPVVARPTTADLPLEIQTLVASSQNLLRLWQAKLIAQDASETKWINGQLVTSAGRTVDQSLDRVKTTNQHQRQFADIAQQREKDILSEISHYDEILRRMAGFSPVEIQAAFDSIRQKSAGVSAREELAIALAQRHALRYANGLFELKTVYSDYESAALR